MAGDSDAHYKGKPWNPDVPRAIYWSQMTPSKWEPCRSKGTCASLLTCSPATCRWTQLSPPSLPLWNTDIVLRFAPELLRYRSLSRAWQAGRATPGLAPPSRLQVYFVRKRRRLSPYQYRDHVTDQGNSHPDSRYEITPLLYLCQAFCPHVAHHVHGLAIAVLALRRWLPLDQT